MIHVHFPKIGCQTAETHIGQQVRGHMWLVGLRISRNLSTLTVTVKSASHQRRGINRSELCLQQQQQQPPKVWNGQFKALRLFYLQNLQRNNSVQEILRLYRKPRSHNIKRGATFCSSKPIMIERFIIKLCSRRKVHTIIDASDTRSLWRSIPASVRLGMK